MYVFHTWQGIAGCRKPGRNAFSFQFPTSIPLKTMVVMVYMVSKASYPALGRFALSSLLLAVSFKAFFITLFLIACHQNPSIRISWIIIGFVSSSAASSTTCIRCCAEGRLRVGTTAIFSGSESSRTESRWNKGRRRPAPLGSRRYTYEPRLIVPESVRSLESCFKWTTTYIGTSADKMSCSFSPALPYRTRRFERHRRRSTRRTGRATRSTNLFSSTVGWNMAFDKRDQWAQGECLF